MRTGNDGAVGYHMDAEMALTEASFLAPDDDTKASYLLHTTADEEEERDQYLENRQHEGTPLVPLPLAEVLVGFVRQRLVGVELGPLEGRVWVVTVIIIVGLARLF